MCTLNFEHGHLISFNLTDALKRFESLARFCSPHISPFMSGHEKTGNACADRPGAKINRLSVYGFAKTIFQCEIVLHMFENTVSIGE